MNAWAASVPAQWALSYGCTRTLSSDVDSSGVRRSRSLTFLCTLTLCYILHPSASCWCYSASHLWLLLSPAWHVAHSISLPHVLFLLFQYLQLQMPLTGRPALFRLFLDATPILICLFLLTSINIILKSSSRIYFLSYFPNFLFWTLLANLTNL